jgi:zinc transport system ATP-binding protein
VTLHRVTAHFVPTAAIPETPTGGATGAPTGGATGAPTGGANGGATGTPTGGANGGAATGTPAGARAGRGWRQLGRPVISLRDVSIGYDDVAAVSGVDLDVRLGDVLALIGPNGSGKSTLVRGILGLAAVLCGTVDLFGEPARSADRRRIGYVPQRHTVGGAIPSTVNEVVASGRLVHRRWYRRAGADDRKAVAEAIEAVGLADRRRAMVATLSGGQQRRVLIARALATRPDVLIMDEPTAGVDAASQEMLTRTLMALVDRGLTLLVVTHEIAALRRVLTRVVSMQGGRIVDDAPVYQTGLERAHETGDGTGREAEREFAQGAGPGVGRGMGDDHHHDAPRPLGEATRRGEPTSSLLGPTGVEGARGDEG